MDETPESAALTSPAAAEANATAGWATGVRHYNSEIFFAAINTTRMPMTVTDPWQPDNPIIFANPAFLQMTGYSEAEIVGSNCRFLQGPDTSRQSITDIAAAIRDRREIAIEIINYRKNGTAFWNALFVSPVYDAAGNLMYFYGSQLDVSRRRDAEEALRLAQQSDPLGDLTGGIAEEFNNLLQVVVGYVDQLRERPDNDSRSLRAINAIGEATKRATTLTQQLQAFSRKQRPEGRPVGLNALIDGMADLLRRTVGANNQLVTNFAADLWACRIDPVQAELALLNIIINARDAMPDGGTITITTCNETIAVDDAAADTGAAGRYATFAVADTGVGMAPEVLQRVMEPFFTTKDDGKGTGLGLSMVSGFARQSGGFVRIESEPGKGSTVKLHFPADETGGMDTAVRVTTRAEELVGSERVLLVEHREDVAELARMILQDYGYHVDVARSAREGLAFLADGEVYDLLLADVIMPGGMNGVLLAREFCRYLPRGRVLLTTGSTDPTRERAAAGIEEFDIITKPYRRVELARRVRQVLDGASGLDR